MTNTKSTSRVGRNQTQRSSKSSASKSKLLISKKSAEKARGSKRAKTAIKSGQKLKAKGAIKNEVEDVKHLLAEIRKDCASLYKRIEGNFKGLLK